MSRAEVSDALPDALEETAPTVAGDAADIVTTVRHRKAPHAGVRYYSESILTDHGKTMIGNFCLSCNTT